jgi:hypothetical protein
MWYYRTVYTILEVKSVANSHLLVLFYFVYFVLCTLYLLRNKKNSSILLHYLLYVL